MTCVASVGPIVKALKSILIRGRERAQALKMPILVSLAQPVSCTASPLSLFAARGRSVLHRAFWGRPAQDFWLVAHGRAAELSCEGDNPYDEVIQEHQALIRNAVIQSPGIRGVGPLFLGGFRFDPRTVRDIIWRSFPDTLMVLPRFLFTKSKGDTWLTINTLVFPETNANVEADALIDEMGSLQECSPDETRQPTTTNVTETSREEWAARVQVGQKAIENGLLTKVVLARQKVLCAEGQFSIERALGQMCRLYPECSIFAIVNNDASFIGATPESLARVEGSRLSVTCLAGSSARGSNPEEDRILETLLLASAKERREHATVVGMLASALKDVCYELHWDETPQVSKLKNVQHLLTPFSGNIHPGYGILDIVKKLHPTPAVAGAPTEQALELILRMEGDRGWYAAPVGWMDHTSSGEFAVAIRSALLRGDKAFLYAGAGIVEGSDPEQEFIETELKFQPMLTALRGS
ncbi:MAG: isochorismate synthase [Dehalococcoidia bacterium]|nr:isochorismate synthase [Dehalococcoidia bacterium]